MAFTVTNQGSAQGYVNTSIISAFTPGANKLLILSVYRQNPNTITSVTGHGTWTFIDEIFTASRRVAIYALITSGSPSSSTVATAFSGSGTAETSVTEIDGADVSGTAANAIEQSNSVSTYHSSPAVITVNLSAFASATNMVLITGYDDTSRTAEAGYSTDFDGSKISTFYLASEDTTPSYTAGGNFDIGRAVALEIKEASGGSGIAVTGQTTNFSYSAINATIDLTGEISVTGATASYNYQSISGLVDLTGEISVLGVTPNYAYDSVNGVIELGAVISVIGQSPNYNYAGVNGVIELTGEININGSTPNYSYSALSGFVVIGEGQVIGTVTAGFADDLYSAAYKPSVITVNFKS